ncbi:hypothetical protein CEXT_747281 [Caerostris extrusa]|uniref:Uncharacterized protein n=1 Tax=Caerostris extrusa TaxID=172846 RepID=A0AAV4M9Y3_CAEEX|nr:hypothetical protein CEXT_747281 [Caerostris extrusa]
MVINKHVILIKSNNAHLYYVLDDGVKENFTPSNKIDKRCSSVSTERLSKEIQQFFKDSSTFQHAIKLIVVPQLKQKPPYTIIDY